MSGSLLIYRDRLGVPSEIAFLRRQYAGFSRLQPVWVGRHVLPGAAALPGAVVRLGGEGLAGEVARLGFRLFGRIADADRERLRRLRPVAVHAQFAKGGALALPLARALGLPLGVTIHGGDVMKRGNWRRSRLLARRWPALRSEAAAFLCVAPHLGEELARRGVPADRIRLQVIGAEPSPTPPPTEQRRGHVFVGRLVEKKGIAIMAEALGRLRAEGWAEPFTVIGDGPLRPLLAGLPEVRLAGWLSPEAVRERLRQAACLWVPSMTAADGDEEGLPSVIVEAMMEGCPVVCTDGPGLAFAAGTAGLVVPAGDAGALAGAARRISADPPLAAALAESGRRRALAEFDAIVQSAALESWFLGLAGQEPAS
jgi:glycosyltransferase involved in cell wall biosynthesis